MANENARRDDNRITTMLGVTNDAAEEIRNLLIDPATGALLVTGAGGIPPGGDTFAISGTDTTPGTFVDQITEGDGIDFTIANPGANENLTISVDAENVLEFVGGTLRFGGIAVDDTVASGDAQNFSMRWEAWDTWEVQNCTDFVVGSENTVNTVSIIGQGVVDLRTIASGAIQIQTPGIVTAAIPANWVLSNTTTGGVVEFVDPTTLPSAVQTEICDADGDTCVEVERTADDDTVRFKAFNVDMMTATSTAFDVFGGVDINLSRDASAGTYSVFNDATSPILGTDSAGVAWSDADETIGAYVFRGTSESTLIYNNTTTTRTNQVTVNPNVVSMAYNDTTATVSNTVNIIAGSVAMQASTGATVSDITVTDATIDIDVNAGDLFINEGSTASGSASALAGDVLTLINAATGRAKWQTPAPDPRYEVRQDANAGTQLAGGGFGSFVAVQYDTETITSSGFTLGGGGVITCNVAGDYRVTTTTNMSTLPVGSVGIFFYRLFINGAPITDQQLQTYHRNSEFQMVTTAVDVTLAATDTVEYRIIRNGGNRDLTSASSVNRLLIETA